MTVKYKTENKQEWKLNKRNKNGQQKVSAPATHPLSKHTRKLTGTYAPKWRSKQEMTISK